MDTIDDVKRVRVGDAEFRGMALPLCVLCEETAKWLDAECRRVSQQFSFNRLTVEGSQSDSSSAGYHIAALPGGWVVDVEQIDEGAPPYPDDLQAINNWIVKNHPDIAMMWFDLTADVVPRGFPLAVHDWTEPV